LIQHHRLYQLQTSGCERHFPAVKNSHKLAQISAEFGVEIKRRRLLAA
jgi:hypothetical protein